MITTESKQLCRITLTFPVDTDEAAIYMKKKIAEIMAEVSDSQIQFSLMTLPGKPSMGG